MDTPRGVIERDFGSDNRAPACPRALDAVVQANEEARAASYGGDRWTARACELAAGLLAGARAEHVVWVPTGTAANLVAVGSCRPGPGSAVLCASDAHVRVDEAGAVERAWGTPLWCVDAPGGRVELDALCETLDRLAANAPFSPEPAVVALTVATEAGRRYSLDEIAAVVDAATAHGARVVIDGARFANALAADPSLAAVLDTGVAAVVLGGTKNGLLASEAVLCADRGMAHAARRAAKQLGHVASKGRFLTAGAVGCLEAGCFLRHAARANDVARSLADGLVAAGVGLHWPVEANLVFARLDGERAAVARSVAGAFDWSPGVVRLACCWDHTDGDVAAVLDALGP